MTDARLILAACRANPDCDTARLVLADALEEEGRFPLAAAYVRESVRFARQGAKVKRRRINLARDYIEWLRTVLGVQDGWGHHIVGGETWDEFIWQAGDGRRGTFHVRRGLPDAVSVTCPMLMERAQALNLFPLTRSRVIGRRPERDDFMGTVLYVWHSRPYPQRWNTWEEDEEAIPQPLFNLLPPGHRWRGHYHSRADAAGALGEASYQFIRQSLPEPVPSCNRRDKVQ